MSAMINRIIRFAETDALNLTKDLYVALETDARPFAPAPGFTFALADMTRDAPHGGEMHPDGDEIVYVVAGRIQVVLELESVEVLDVGPKEGLVIPRGVWHRIHVKESATLMTITPGPAFESR